jgi:hypothetical protein
VLSVRAASATTPAAWTVGHVARGDGDGCTQLGELGAQFGHAGRVRAASAGEQQVLGAVAGQPAGDLGAEGSRAAGDQHGATRLPGDHVAAGRADQSADGQARRPQRELVLGSGAGQSDGQQLPCALVDGRREVDETAPALGVLQAHHSTETPDLRLYRVPQTVRPAGGHRTVRHAPERRVDPGVAQGLHQQGGGGETGGHRRVLRVRGLVEREQ